MNNPQSYSDPNGAVIIQFGLAGLGAFNIWGAEPLGVVIGNANNQKPAPKGNWSLKVKTFAGGRFVYRFNTATPMMGPRSTLRTSASAGHEESLQPYFDDPNYWVKLNNLAGTNDWTPVDMGIIGTSTLNLISAKVRDDAFVPGILGPREFFNDIISNTGTGGWAGSMELWWEAQAGGFWGGRLPPGRYEFDLKGNVSLSASGTDKTTGNAVELFGKNGIDLSVESTVTGYGNPAKVFPFRLPPNLAGKPFEMTINVIVAPGNNRPTKLLLADYVPKVDYKRCSKNLDIRVAAFALMSVEGMRYIGMAAQEEKGIDRAQIHCLPIPPFGLRTSGSVQVSLCGVPEGVMFKSNWTRVFCFSLLLTLIVGLSMTYMRVYLKDDVDVLVARFGNEQDAQERLMLCRQMSAIALRADTRKRSRVVTSFVAALDDHDSDVRSCVLSELVRFGKVPDHFSDRITRTARADIDNSVRTNAITVLPELLQWETATTCLTEILEEKDSDRDVIIAAIHTIQRIAESVRARPDVKQRVLGKLKAHLKTNDCLVVLAAAEGYYSVDPDAEEPLEMLRRCLPEHEIGPTIALLMGGLKNQRPRALSILKDCLEDPRERMRAHAIQAIHSLGGNDAETSAALCKRLSDVSPSVRRIALQCSKDLGLNEASVIAHSIRMAVSDPECAIMAKSTIEDLLFHSKTSKREIAVYATNTKSREEALLCLDLLDGAELTAAELISVGTLAQSTDHVVRMRAEKLMAKRKM